MNWFERYGIVGMFFVVMTGVWYSLLFPYSLQQIPNLSRFPQLILGIGGLAVLPCGYLITIFQKQMFYLRPKFVKKLLSPPIHQQMWDKMTSAGQEPIKEAEKINNFLDNISEEIIRDEIPNEVR